MELIFNLKPDSKDAEKLKKLQHQVKTFTYDGNASTVHNKSSVEVLVLAILDYACKTVNNANHRTCKILQLSSNKMMKKKGEKKREGL